jgi:hypothetical protein
MRKLIAPAVGFFAFLTVPVTAQGNRSLTDSEWPAPAQRVEQAPPVIPLPSFPRTPEAALQESVIILRATVEELSQSLALANAEAETFKRQAEELALRLDTLGLLELDGSPEALEQKLLAAMREVRLLETRNLELESALLGLTESILAVLMEAADVPPNIRVDLETQMRKAGELLGSLPGVEEARPVETTLTNAMIVETKPEISLLILNVGSTHGARIGTPFHIFRGDQIIGQALVVDVRERISGAIIQNLEREDQPPKTGDRLRVITRQ